MSALTAVPTLTDGATSRPRAYGPSRNSKTTLAHGSVGALMTTREVAVRCAVPESTVRFWRVNNTGPEGFKVGRHVRYPTHVVEAWLVEQRDEDRAQRASLRRDDLVAV